MFEAHVKKRVFTLAWTDTNGLRGARHDLKTGLLWGDVRLAESYFVEDAA